MSDDEYWHGKYVQAEARVSSIAAALEEMEQLYNRTADQIEAQAKEINELKAALAKWELWNSKPPELEWAVLLCSWCNTTHACTAQQKCLAPTSKAIG